VSAALRLDVNPFDEHFLANPYAHHAVLRDAGPVVWLESIACFGVARYEEVKVALSDHLTFCSGRGVGLADFALEKPWRPLSLLLEVDPPLHDRTRGLMNKVVSFQALKNVRPIWQAHAQALVEKLVAQRRFDAVSELGEQYPMLVFPDAIGILDEGREKLLTYAAAVFDAFGPRNAVYERSNQHAADAVAWVAQACRRENLKPHGWGMAVFAAADRGECSEEEAERLVRSFLSAGVDTTVNGISNLILAFSQAPDEWTKLRSRPQLARHAFDESLRWDSTVQTFFRTTTRAVRLGGVDLPQGAKVLLFLAAANRDPRKWSNADRFEIERPASRHVGFGHGIHQCLGQMVARLEAELLLEALIARVRVFHLTSTPVRRLNNTLHAVRSLPIEIEPA
jgi:4-methoxybenzoate monooxygenase (O-demethylating)